MTSSIVLIFPHQLFQKAAVLACSECVYLVEETLFFHQYHFHQQKILLHRASMKAYEQWLNEHGKKVTYIEAIDPLCDTRKLLPHLAKKKISTIHYSDVADTWLHQRLQKAAAESGIQLKEQPTPNFLNTPEDTRSFFDQKKTYFQTAFYLAQRKERQLLLDDAQQPLGGQWTFDADNRKKYPKTLTPPVVKPAISNEHTKEAKVYVQKYFSHHYGSSERFVYPINFKDAELWLAAFLKERFHDFGVYEDAIVTNAHYLHHSVLTPMLNIGLLNPQQILDKTIAYANQHNIPLNSLEGFIRQIVGWREFIRLVYHREGTKQRTTNYWQFTRKIPASFWNGTTGILPVDNVIKKTLQTGYSHHIERLMVMGNFMLLCEFDPDEVHRWFMEMYVDAYDWVMVPNVYGMTQFADGGLMTTKPYISGSNYLLKMSDYDKGPWTAIWDALFWRFMHVHRSFFLKNPRLGMLVKTFDKMPAAKQAQHLQIANDYLATLGATSLNPIHDTK